MKKYLTGGGTVTGCRRRATGRFACARCRPQYLRCIVMKSIKIKRLNNIMMMKAKCFAPFESLGLNQSEHSHRIYNVCMHVRIIFVHEPKSLCTFTFWELFAALDENHQVKHKAIGMSTFAILIIFGTEHISKALHNRPDFIFMQFTCSSVCRQDHRWVVARTYDATIRL